MILIRLPYKRWLESMRINQFVARGSGMSRRRADQAIKEGRVKINDSAAAVGQIIDNNDTVYLDNHRIITTAVKTIVLNKPDGYVCSRNGQGSKTIYDLLPNALHHLKPVGRLDKDSSGLVLLTNDGHLAQQLTHPSFQKQKIYKISLDKTLLTHDKVAIEKGVLLKDGLSALILSGNGVDWKVMLSEGRNRQVRRTFKARGYHVKGLHRVQFGPYSLGRLNLGDYITVP